MALFLAVLATGLFAPRMSAQLHPLIVRGVHFKGNKGVDPDFLAASIATTQSSFFQSSGIARTLLGWLVHGERREFNQLLFEGDIDRLKIAFILSGYPNVKVDTIVKRTRDAIDVTFKITEGTPTKLVNFDIFGLDSVKNAFRIRQDLPIAAGDIGSDYKIHEARDTVEQRLRNQGYPLATVTYVEGDRHHGSTQDVRFDVKTGPYSRFGAIHVEAGPGIDTSFVAALMSTRPGAEYRESDILRSQRNLYTSDLFRTVAVDTAIADATVPVVVKVTPNLGHRAKASAGYGTDDCFRIASGWTARNFPGTGLVTDLTGQLSKIGVASPFDFGLRNNVCGELKRDSIGSRSLNYGLNAALRRSAFLTPNNSASFSVFATRRSEFKVYLREEVGAAFAITHTTASGVPITLTYRIADGTTTANPASFCAFFNTCDPAAIAVLQQRRLQGALTLSVLRQRVNNPLDPLRGTVLSASATVSSRFLGSSATQQFGKLVGDASGFLPITRTVVLAGHVRLGYIYAPSVDLGTQNGNFVPPDQRFYAGGANDVRGYDQNELGPVVYVVPADSVKAATDTTPLQILGAVRVAPTGGTRLAVANLELRFPTPIFAGRLKGAVFVDAGTLANSGESAPLRITPGFGLRYTSPLGAIRFDVAYNEYPLQSGRLYSISSDGSLTKVADDFLRQSKPHFTLHFSIGQPFP